ncbi:C-type mannose receptor 2-like [Tachysurus ichikawai]
MKMKAVLSILLLAAMTGASTHLRWKKYIFVNLQRNWTDAQEYCRKNYVDLSSIETEEELNQFQSDINIQCSSDCWIGLSRIPQMNFINWSDGNLLEFSYWSSDESFTDYSKNCVYIHNHWHSDSCNHSLNLVCYTWVYSLVVVQEMKTWEEALNYCRTKYSGLVSLFTDSDHAAVNNKTDEILTSVFWTGLHFLDGSWFWVNSTQNEEEENRIFMPSCPAPRYRCGAQSTKSNVLENRDCEEKMNFVCYNETM